MDAGYRAVADAPHLLRERPELARLLAVLVLAGLWLMHGVSATTNAGCHGVPVMMSMSASAVGPQAAAGASRVSAKAPESAPDLRPAGTAASVPDGPGETCLSGQPPSPGDLLLGLLAAFVLVGLVACSTARSARPLVFAWSRARRRGPPGTAGRALLTAVCVSRT